MVHLRSVPRTSELAALLQLSGAASADSHTSARLPSTQAAPPNPTPLTNATLCPITLLHTHVLPTTIGKQKASRAQHCSPPTRFQPATRSVDNPIPRLLWKKIQLARTHRIGVSAGDQDRRQQRQHRATHRHPPELEDPTNAASPRR